MYDCGRESADHTLDIADLLCSYCKACHAQILGMMHTSTLESSV